MSDWEDEPNPKPVDSETWKDSQETTTNDNGGDNDDGGGWGEDNGALTWAEADGYVQLNSRSNRLDDQDGSLWGGGGAGNRPNASYGRGRGGSRQNFQDRNNRYNDRQRNNDSGFGYSSSGYSNSSDNRYRNGHAAKKFFGGNSSSNSSRSNGWGNDESDGWAQNGGGRSAGGGSGCFKCGEDGHFARECGNSTSGFQSKGRPGGGSYIPKEEDNFDELYKNGISTGINFDRYYKFIF